MLLLSLGGNGGGGGSSREYLGSIIPRYTEATPLITASSTSQYAQPPYSAFDGIESTNLRDPNHAWTSNTGLTNQWIQYHFPEKRYFTKIVIKAFSNYSGDWTGDIKIQGSEDGTIWRDVLKNSSTETVTITAKYQEMTTIEIDLNQSLEYNYIRLLGVDALCVDSAPSCFIDDIYVYGGKVVSGSLITKLLTYSNNNAASKLTFISALPLNSTLTLSMLVFKNLPTNVTLGTLTRINDKKFTITYTVDSGTTFVPPAFLSIEVSNTLFDEDYFSGTLNESSEFVAIKVEMEVEQGTNVGLNYTKTNSEWAIGVWCDSINGSIGYYGPMLIGLTTASVNYGYNDDNTCIYGGTTYHYNTSHWTNGRQAKPLECELVYSSSDLITAGVLESNYTVPDLAEAALDFYFGA